MDKTVRYLIALSALAACGCTSAAAPSLGVMCPASITVTSPNGGPVTVTYPAAVAAGGPGITTSCSPASGSTFNVGRTSVTCTAEVYRQNAACTFTVTVAPPPHLDATKFVAFGDSITFGSSGDRCPGGTFTSRSLEARLADVRSLWTDLVPPDSSYPSVLQQAMRERYTAQVPVVVNEGYPGESVTDSTTWSRFVNALNTDAPEGLLLLEGINDLHGFDLRGIPHGQGISLVAAGLRAMVVEGRRRNIKVFLATVLPEREGGCRAYAEPDLIPRLNDQIRAIAASENVDLVDLHAAFLGRESIFLARDGLHPNEAGYAFMAKNFLKAIQQRLENAPASILAPTRTW